MNPSQTSPQASPFLLHAGLANLTACEWKLLLLLANDLTNAELAQTLSVTLKSVENYVNRIGGKLNLRGHHKLAKFARQHGLELGQLYKTHINIPPP